MKIAYLINQYPWVSHSFIRREIRALEAMGIQVERMSIRAVSKADLPDPNDHDELARTRSILSLGLLGLVGMTLSILITRPARFMSALTLAIRTGHRSHRGMAAQMVYFAEACVLARWLAGSDVNHVHAHFGTNSAAVAMFAHVLGGPAYSMTVHGPEEYDKPEALALGEKIRRARFVAAISEFGRSQLMRWCEPEHWPKLHVVRCTVDETFLGQATPVSPNDRLVCVGRIGYEKGQLVLVEALAKLADAGYTPQVVFVGDGPLRSELETRIRRLDLHKRVSVTGWSSGQIVRQQMLDAQAFVLPTFAEGLPVVIMEAFALQRPVLSTYVAGIPELVRDGENGWLVPAGSVQALSEALGELMRTPAERLRTMGQAGAERVGRDHNAKTEARRLADLFAGNPATRLNDPSIPNVPSKVQQDTVNATTDPMKGTA